MSFADTAAQGDVCGALSAAAVTGSLWAIGIGWATAIREIALLTLPKEGLGDVATELVATGVITALGVGVAIGAARCARCRPPPRPPRPAGPLPVLRRRGETSRR